MLKTLKGMISLLMITFLSTMISVSAINVRAESIVNKDGLLLKISTDKESYSQGEEVQLIVDIKNNGKTDVNGISVETFLPTEFSLKNGSKVTKDISIKAGEEYSCTQEVLATFSSNDGETSLNSDNNQSTANTKGSPGTGDHIRVGVYILIGVVSLIGLAILLKNEKRLKILSVFLCITLGISAINLGVLSEEIEKSTITEQIKQ